VCRVRGGLRIRSKIVFMDNLEALEGRIEKYE